MSRYTIAEWFGEPLVSMLPERRRHLAQAALGRLPQPACPFQVDTPRCTKKGGVCSLRMPGSAPLITCPRRFDEGDLIARWLGAIVGFPDIYLAREVPFMYSPSTGKAAGRVDLVVATDREASAWFGLEIQAVYFSGPRMQSDFEALAQSNDVQPPAPTAVRRPDWRSSSAKRLMPQLQVKAPTLRRWGTKLAVAVDLPFFNAIGGPTDEPSTDLNDGDIVWLVPHVNDDFRLESGHWEVLSLEKSSEKLLSAQTVRRAQFEDALRARLKPIAGDDDREP